MTGSGSISFKTKDFLVIVPVCQCSNIRPVERTNGKFLLISSLGSMILTGIILAKLLTVGKPSVKIISSPGSVALFAGYQVGEFKSLNQIKNIWQKDKAFSPKIKNSLRNQLLQGWKLAIKKTLA